jgi:hypothetical protein
MCEKGVITQQEFLEKIREERRDVSADADPTGH